MVMLNLMLFASALLPKVPETVGLTVTVALSLTEVRVSVLGLVELEAASDSGVSRLTGVTRIDKSEKPKAEAAKKAILKI